MATGRPETTEMRLLDSPDSEDKAERIMAGFGTPDQDGIDSHALSAAEAPEVKEEARRHQESYVWQGSQALARGFFVVGASLLDLNLELGRVSRLRFQLRRTGLGRRAGSCRVTRLTTAVKSKACGKGAAPESSEPVQAARKHPTPALLPDSPVFPLSMHCRWRCAASAADL